MRGVRWERALISSACVAGALEARVAVLEPPVRERDERREQVLAGRREVVLHARGHARVDAALDEPVLLELAQRGTEHPARHAVDLPQQLVEPQRALAEPGEDEHAPLRGQHADRRLQRRDRFVVGRGERLRHRATEDTLSGPVTVPERPVLVAPDSFKGTFRAPEVAAAIGRGLERAGLMPPDLCPVADGGEGTLEALLPRLGGEVVAAAAHDPLGRELQPRSASSRTAGPRSWRRPRPAGSAWWPAKSATPGRRRPTAPAS